MKQHGWSYLEPGDLVDIVAPGMRPKAGVLLGIKKFLKSWDLEARIPVDLLGRDLICSNSREQRFRHLVKALQAKDSKMVWCLRGGYGSHQLVPKLAGTVRAPNKIFMGLSDTTSLHSFLVQEWGWSTIHGPNIDRFILGHGKAPEQKRFRDLLFGKTRIIKHSIKALNNSARGSGLVQGRLIGGNLITLQSAFGTDFQLKTRGQILFFEDIGERAYRVERVLEHMQQLGLFQGVKAILFGQFTGGHEPGGKSSLVPRLLKQFAESVSLPVFSGVRSGHGDNQLPLPLGTKAIIKKGLQPKLEIDSGAIH